MADLTPEEIQQARKIATYAPKMGYALVSSESELLARAVLALTEQAEPVSRDELINLIDEFLGRPGRLLHELSHYTITRKPQDNTGRGEHR